MGPCIPLFKIRTDSAVRGSLNSLLKNRTKSAIRGSLLSLFNIWTDSAVRGAQHPPFRNSDQIDGQWIPAFPFQYLERFGRPWTHPFFKFGPNRSSVDPHVPLRKIWTNLAARGFLPPLFRIRTDSIVRGSLHLPFRNSDRIGGPWIPASPSTKPLLCQEMTHILTL